MPPSSAQAAGNRSAREPFFQGGGSGSNSGSFHGPGSGSGSGHGQSWQRDHPDSEHHAAEDPEAGRSAASGDKGKEQPEQKHGVFPLRLFACLPLGVRALIPGTWQVIQDGTHLTLLLGLVSALVLLITEIVVLATIGNRNTPEKDIFLAVMALLAILPNLRYLIKMMGTYDESITVREQTIADRKQELIDSYEGLVKGIDELLGKATQSSATLAESGFESKRRDFIRFLDRVEERSGNIVVSGAEGAALVEQFRKFVQHWLHVFAECSVDPINKPKYVLTAEELAQYKTIGEIAGQTKERLKHTEVRFISSHYDQDTKLLRGFRANAKRMSMAPGLLPLPPPPGTGSQIEIELAAQRRPQTVHEDEEFRDDGRELISSWHSAASKQQQPSQQEEAKRCCPCEWLSCGSYGCGCRRSEQDSGFPRFAMCKCAQLAILSQDHMFLMIGLFFALLQPSLMAIFIHWNGLVMIAVVFYIVCLVVLLVRFEQIDIIQRLEHEIGKLQAEADALKERREQMVQFWTDMQNLTDIWVHRTTPRLDLLKEVHSCLEDIKQPGDLKAALSGVNSRIELLETKLPELALWRCDGQITEGEKKNFAQRIKRIYENTDQALPTILSGVSRLIEDGIPTVRVARPNGMAQLTNAPGNHK